MSIYFNFLISFIFLNETLSFEYINYLYFKNEKTEETCLNDKKIIATILNRCAL